jgi:hypothetical protein
MLAEWLATDQSGAQHQVSVIMFGTNAKLVFPLHEVLSAEAQAAYKKALTDNNQPMGGTNIIEALKLAKAELDKGRSGPNDKKALIFLSDGVCEPINNTTDAQRQQCEQDIRQLVQSEFGAGKSGPIFTIALTSDAFKQDPNNHIFKNLWQEISVTTGGDYYEPAEAGSALLDSFVKILQQLFGLPIQSPPPAVDSPTVMTVTLPNDLLQAGFTLIKYGQGISMTLTRPDGVTLDPSSPGTRHSMSEWTESYNISSPPGGIWVAHIGGSGKVILLSVPFTQNRFSVDLTQPAAAHPQGKPMAMEVRVLDTNRVSQTVQSMQVEVRLPGGTTTTLPMLASGNVYTALMSNTEELGTYVLHFTGAVKENTFSAQQSVRVVTAPWFKFVEPQVGGIYTANLAIPVRVQVMLDTAPLAALNPGDQFETSVRLLTTDGQIPDMQFLHPSGGGVYSGTLTAGSAGAYLSQAQLRYTSATGERFEDSAQVAFDVTGKTQAVVQPSPTAPPVYATPLALQSGAQRVSIANDFTWLYVALGLFGLVLLGSQVLVANRLRDLRVAYLNANPQQDDILNNRIGFDTNLHNLTAKGWQDVAAQVVADALQQTVSIDSSVGILDASSDPCPKYSLITCDGREIIFTTSLRTLRQMKLVRRHDRVVDVSALSGSRHADANMLWHYALAQRGQVSVASPSWAHWYIVVRESGARYSGMRAMTRKRNWLQRLFKPRRGGL